MYVGAVTRRVFAGVAVSIGLGLAACGTTAAEEGATSETAESESESGDGDPTGDGDGDGDDPTGDGDGDASGDCHANVVVMGYWPPTNEMLRPWSTDPAQNPEGWTGQNWRDYGYDVYAFFPEFPPDGDPSNDEIGDPGSVGSEDSDLQVDYQDTSLDFWAIVDEYEPAILITTSRGGQIGWELEAVEGGHGGGGPDPAMDWYPDGYGDEFFPTEATIDPRSWAGISTYRQGAQLDSQLPLDAILAATAPLGLTSVEIEQGTSGNYLSGFLGLHGLLYNAAAPHNLAAGHIHVGPPVPVEDARTLIETTLEVVIEAHPLDCDPG